MMQFLVFQSDDFKLAKNKLSNWPPGRDLARYLMHAISSKFRTAFRHPVRDEDGWCWEVKTKLGLVVLSTTAIENKSGESYWLVQVGDLTPSWITIVRAIAKRNPPQSEVLGELQREILGAIDRLSSCKNARWVDYETYVSEF